MRGRRILLAAALVTEIIATVAHAESPVSGTYVVRGASDVAMLQLTETSNGQISGVLSNVELQADGHIQSDQAPLTGAIGADTITLTLHLGPLGFFPSSMAGSVKGDSIELQQLGSNGTLAEWHFTRSSPAAFQEAAQQLKARGQAITLSANLAKETTRTEQNVRAVEAWILDANTHLQRINNAKTYILKISGKMQSLIERERVTRGGVERSQLSVAVSQGDVAGDQADIQANQVWDRVIETGKQIVQTFQSYHRGCGKSKEWVAHGATPEIVQRWETACAALMATHSKFDPVLRDVLQRRAEFSVFQAEEKQKRSRLVRQASQLE